MQYFSLFIYCITLAFAPFFSLPLSSAGCDNALCHCENCSCPHPCLCTEDHCPGQPAITLTSQEDTPPSSLNQLSKAFNYVAKRATPAVVFVKVHTNSSDGEELNNPFGYQSPFDQFGDEFFNRFFGAPQRGPKQQAPQVSHGSGFFVSSDGYIMTNAHVVKSAEKMTVILNDDRELDATLIGEDPKTDIAIIKVEGKNFPFLKFADSDAVDVGEWVVAIGSPFQLETSVTAGIISGKKRQKLGITDFEDYLQTDAAINPGYSGSPLLKLNAEVVGVNSAIVSRSGGYMGIGLAVSSNLAKNVMDQLIDKGAVIRGFLGVSLQSVDKDIADAFQLPKAEGALVSEVIKDSPADKAGVKQGDIILECNKIGIKSIQGFRNEISLMTPGSTVALKLNRKGKLVSFPVTLGTTSDALASAGGVVQQLGMEIDTLTAELAKQLGLHTDEQGVVITKIKPGSPAAVAGMRPGFLIQAVNHKKVVNIADFNEAMSTTDNKKRALMLVRQGNLTRFYSIKIE